MKTNTGQSWFFRMNVFIGLAPLLALAAEPATVHPEEQKSSPGSHVLFTGTDIQVEHKGALYQVRGLEKDAFVIQVNDHKVTVPMKTTPEKLKVSRVQHLTDRSATVKEFKYERTYTPANDPVRKWTPAMAATEEMSEAAATAETQMNNTPQTMEVREGPGMGTMKIVSNPQYGVATANFQRNSQRVSGNMGSTSAYVEKIAEEKALELFDALDVQFEVAAEKPIENPYVVVTAKYHEKNDAKYVRNWLFAKELDPIDATPRKVTVREAGFPLGFVVDSLQVHLYENGVEIPTDLSDHRAVLSRDETHEYLMIEYASAHKNDTSPPRIALAGLPADWPAHRSDASLQKSYYVKVDQTGHPTGVFENENLTVPAADSYCTGVLENLLFLPALQKGRPVDGVIRIRPGSLGK